MAAAQLDAYWTQIRLAQMDVPGMAFVKSHPKTIPLGISRDVGQATEKPDDCPAMSDAVDLYLRLRGNGRPKTFAVDIRRAAGYLTQLAQDRPSLVIFPTRCTRPSRLVGGPWLGWVICDPCLLKR